MINEKKIDIIRKSKPYSRLDIIIISLALLLAVSYIIISFALRTEGSIVRISVAGKQNKYYNLSEDREIDLDFEGKSIKIVIEDGSIYVKETDCPDKVCVHTGKIKYSGQWIACSHFKVFIIVEGSGLHITTG